jgi:hypothetical protein
MQLLAGELARLRYQEVAALAERPESRQRHALRLANGAELASRRGQRTAWLRSLWPR